MKFIKFVLLFYIGFLFLIGCRKESRYEIVTGTIVDTVGTVFVLDKEEGRVWQCTGNNNNNWTYTDLEGVAKFEKKTAEEYFDRNNGFIPDVDVKEKKMFFVDKNFNGRLETKKSEKEKSK